YLGGGPGSSAMPNAPWMKYWKYLDERDFILFEQRGTTYAQPNLACPEWSKAWQKAQQLQLTNQQADSMLSIAARACKIRLEKEGIDLNAYRTTETAKDIIDLISVLGIKEYNILSLSYGTKIAQTLMRDHPEGIRSVVMDSPLPLEANYDLESIDNLLDAYSRCFDDCAADPNCHKSFPDLQKRFYEFLEETNTTPLEVAITNPNTNKEEVFKIRGNDIVYLLAMLKTAQMSALPLLISNIMEGDMEIIQNKLRQLFDPPRAGNGLGMRLSVWCAEETAFINAAEIAEATSTYSFLKGASPVLYDPKICDIWGVQPANKIENEAIQSDIPCLIINGAYDNETPVKWGKQLHQNLRASFHMIFPGFHHCPSTYWDNPCAMHAAQDFFQNPQEFPKTECFTQIKVPLFKTE
ncbi:MAG: alpha/beta hydrolase, partial [Bacteroidota bacterium]